MTLQFHPDRPHGDGRVIDSMVADGRYRSQFATGISNGGMTAHPGGDRWRWESRLFEGRYDDRPADERPVYGAWNRRGDPYGGSIRFGSCYLRLRPEALDRATFCFPDSVFDPVDVGERSLLPHLCRLADEVAAGVRPPDPLDDYVEAHVHGGVRFDTDVEAIVLDPCFVGTDIERAARRLGCPVEWHPGFRARTSAFDPDYRGARVVDLARSLGDELTPSMVGEAACSGVHPPQQVKQVWHCLARFGRRPEPVSP